MGQQKRDSKTVLAIVELIGYIKTVDLGTI